MNLNQLRAFYLVGKKASFSKAAEDLFVTAPAVFVQVRTLERYLGCRLFDKLGKDLCPTEMGRILFDYAERIFALEREADIVINELRALNNRELRIGAAKAVAQYLMPLIVSSFRDFYPGIKILLSEGSSGQLVKQVVSHDLELAVVARMPYPESINAIPFAKDKVMVVVSPGNLLRRRKKISLEELNGEQMICMTVESGTGFTVRTEFEKQRLRPNVVLEADNFEFIKDMVKKEKGSAFLGAICVRNEISRGEMAAISVKGSGFTLDIDIIHLKGKTLSPASSSLLSFLLQIKDPEDLGMTVDQIEDRLKASLPWKAAKDCKKA